MRREDLLQALLVRFVDPQREEQDWQLIAALFYSLTKLLLPAQRLEQLYYQYLQSHGGRAAMEAACKEYELQLQTRLRQRAANAEGPNVTVAMGGHRVSSGSVVSPRGAAGGFLPPITTGLGPSPSGSSGGAGVTGAGGGGTMARLFTSLPAGGAEGTDDGSFPVGAALQQLTAEQRKRWHRLRQEPISPDVLIALVQSFTLVEGAAVFLAPVCPSTVMEFNGISSGPYAEVVVRPLSLMGIKSRVLAARRDYELRKRQTQTNPSPASTDTNATTRKRGRPPASTVAMVETSEATGANAGVSDDKEAIRTLQELERAVWHIAANCVVFNAPESYYPLTARQFAVACMEIIDGYCLQRVLGA
ncbi:hypothetical protein DQ04_08201000 [Trypanosoma grayi]|uniref:hypothetical protein n=1 Tax=Trypanosoma grayi TaxID=71804 RepID=UPI0004F4A593|nr:hypothetical protein DQ04_08201000 [Trypanosoma grayi]KEG08020.1 hypothetical protein DQ04_08201000 [Trypanosoma grayi]